MKKSIFCILLIITLIISSCNNINLSSYQSISEQSSIDESTQSSKYESSNSNSEENNDDNLYANAYFDLTYGEHERNTYDIYLAKSDSKTPFILYIHGGAFVRKDKSELPVQMRNKALENGISIASINYPLVPTMSLKEVIENIILAVQYFKYMSDEYNLDKDLFACYGRSAGAGSSFLIAVSEDFADPDNENPIKRESTDLFAAGLYLVQATYDSSKWAEILGIENTAVERFLEQTGEFVDMMYGIKGETIEEIEEIEKNREFLDMFSKISIDDPPLYIWNDMPEFTPDFVHTPAHSKAIYNKYLEIGIYVEYYQDAQLLLPKDFVDFMIERLNERDDLK